MTIQEMFEEIGASVGQPAAEVATRFDEQLTDAERRHLRIRYGIDDGEGLRVIEKVAHEMGISRGVAVTNERRIFAKFKQGGKKAVSG